MNPSTIVRPQKTPAAKAAFLPFDAFVLANVASEIRRVVLPARVQKITQPTSSELLLLVFGASGAHKILLSVDPQNFRVHLTQMRRENPVNPFAFCQVCRKYLDGAFLETVEIPHFDRVLFLHFRGADGERFGLVAELMGRNSNLVLTGGGGIIRGSLRLAPPNSVRPLRLNTPYVDPPGLNDKRDPLTVGGAGDTIWDALPIDEADAEKWLAATFGGIGPFAAREIWARANKKSADVPEAFAALMDDVKAERFAPHHIVGTNGQTRGVWAFAPQSVPPGLRFLRESVSVALDTFYQTRSEVIARNAEISGLQKTLFREIAYREKEAASMEATLRESHRADGYEQTANNLLAQLHLVEKGDGSVTLADLYDTSGEGREITVVLDPKLNGQENAQAYFARAKKSREAHVYAQTRLESVRGELSRLNAISRQLSEAADAVGNGPNVERLRTETEEIVGAARMGGGGANVALPGAGKNEKPWAGHKIRTYTLDGYELLIGETAEANDFLTTRLAQSSDFWFHVRGGPGAHGVLRTNNQPARVPDSVLRRAAQAVAARSGTSVKHSGLVAVDMMEKKHVRKPRKAKPGLVTYTPGRERVLDVTPALP